MTPPTKPALSLCLFALALAIGVWVAVYAYLTAKPPTAKPEGADASVVWWEPTPKEWPACGHERKN